MKANAIELKKYVTEKFTTRTRDIPKTGSYFDFAVQRDEYPETIKRYEISQKENALSDLAELKSTCEYLGNHVYRVTAYALEYFEEVDGEFIDGSDFDIAEEVSLI